MSCTYRMEDWLKYYIFRPKFIKSAINVYLREHHKKDKLSHDLVLMIMRWTQDRDKVEILCPEDLFHQSYLFDFGKAAGGMSLIWHIEEVKGIKGIKKTYTLGIDPRISFIDQEVDEISWGITLAYGRKKHHHEMTWDLTATRAEIVASREIASVYHNKKVYNNKEEVMWMQVLFDKRINIKMRDKSIRKKLIKSIGFMG